MENVGGRKMKRKKMWYFGAGVVVIMLLILPVFSVYAVPYPILSNPSHIKKPDIEILNPVVSNPIGPIPSPGEITDVEAWPGDVYSRFKGSVGRGYNEFFLTNVEIDVEVYGPEADIDIITIVDCHIRLERSYSLPRLAYFYLIMREGGSKGEPVGESGQMCLSYWNSDGAILAYGEVTSYKNEIIMIWCKLTATPCLAFIDREIPARALPWGLRESRVFLITLNITHIY